MTDHHDVLRVAPDPARAEDLRRHLHARLASGVATDGVGSAPSAGAEPADRGRLVVLETGDRLGPDEPAAPLRRPPRTRVLVAAAALVVAVVGGLLVTGSDDDGDIDAVTATQTSPFVGAWSSTEAGGRSVAMYIDQWDVDTYQVRVPGRSGTLCTRVGRPTADGSLMVTRFALPSPYIQPACDRRTGPPPTEELTLDRSGETAQLTDGSGRVWREQPAPPPDAEDIVLLEAFLAARVAGEGAEKYARDVSKEELVPLLYATTSGAAYERFEIERAQDPQSGPVAARVYDVRLLAEDGTVLQQRFQVTHEEGQPRVARYEGPTLEDGRAVALPYTIVDGKVAFGVASTWRVLSHQDDHMHLLQRFGAAHLVLAAEPLSIASSGLTCDGPAPADAAALARTISSGHEDDVVEVVPQRIAGIDGFRVDVAMPDQARPLCSFVDEATLGTVQSGGTHVRFYLVDLPGDPARILTFAFMTTADGFGDSEDEIAEIVESIRTDR